MDYKFRIWNGETMDYKCESVMTWNGILVPEDDDIIMQSTGLKDQNSKEIFDGDILLCREMHDSNVYGRAWKQVGLPDNPGYSIAVPQVIKQKSPIDWYIPDDISYHPEWWEIVGNIHENPELLKENK